MIVFSGTPISNIWVADVALKLWLLMVSACVPAKEHIFLNLKSRVFLPTGWLPKYHRRVLSVGAFSNGRKKKISCVVASGGNLLM